MLLKTRNNVISTPTTAVAVANIDGLRTDGAFGPYSEGTDGGTFPATAVSPVNIVVSAGGDTQTLTDNGATVFTRNFGLEWWGDWV